VLVDTNVLIALVDRSDELHAKASGDLQKLAKAELCTTDAVLCESVFALARADQRGRLSLLLERLPIAPLGVDDPSALRREIFAWLAKYAEHEPDYADAELCVLAAWDKRLRIWTYDSEFTRVWRKPNGRRAALIGQA
jgi:predicted nucleic acid-binding protein